MASISSFAIRYSLLLSALGLLANVLVTSADNSNTVTLTANYNPAQVRFPKGSSAILQHYEKCEQADNPSNCPDCPGLDRSCGKNQICGCSGGNNICGATMTFTSETPATLYTGTVEAPARIKATNFVVYGSEVFKNKQPTVTLGSDSITINGFAGTSEEDSGGDHVLLYASTTNIRTTRKSLVTMFLENLTAEEIFEFADPRLIQMIVRIVGKSERT